MGTDHDAPPDDLEDETPLEDRAALVREAWIRAVREFKRQRTGLECFYKTKPIWDGGLDPHTRRFYKKPIWPRIVTEADELRLDPFLLIRVLFETTVGDRAPQPPDVIKMANIQKALRRETECPATIAAEVRSQSQIFRSALWSRSRTTTDPNPNTPTRLVINDLSLSLSPLFRYAMALIAKQYDQADAWKDRAEFQYRQRPAVYAKYWAHLLPAHMTSPEPARAGAQDSV